MYHIDFEHPVHVHFIGIGGISMSGLADILFSKNFTVSGSDMKSSSLTEQLAAKGMKIAIGHSADNITDNIDLVVYTAAINQANPELQSAKDKNIALLTRAELLGEIMANYKVAIGVSGTHGKTTTTSMLAEILLAGHKDPTVSVGGILPSIGGNLRLGASDHFLTEACEYTNSFLSFFPTIEIILNIEEDHMDFFKDIHEIRTSFRNYVKLLPEHGLLVINADIEAVEEIYDGLPCKVVTVGQAEDSDLSARDISYNNTGCCSYTLQAPGIPPERIQLDVPGLHNVYNSLAAIAVGLHLGISMKDIAKGLGQFHGTDRRFQKKGVLKGYTIIDDYAHHPAEIRATLNSADNYPHKRVVCIFQPHTYTRTHAFLKDFAQALSKADQVILADIYAAREINTLGITSLDLKRELDALGANCIYEPDFAKIEDYIRNHCTEGDLVITMGAGNIVEVGESLLR